MNIFMETTKIPVSKTVGEIQSLLGQYGCSGVMVLYDKGEVSAVAFEVMHLDLNRKVAFRLPCRWEPIFKELTGRQKRPRDGKEAELMEQAKRVAWRQILRWVEAQLALVETKMVKVLEVFLPYIQTNLEGQTLFEKIEKENFKAVTYQP